MESDVKLADPGLAGVKFESESEKITTYHWKVLGVVVFAYLFDGLDSMIFSLCLAMIMTDYGISKAIVGLIASIFICGQILGGLSVGVFGDIMGRRKGLIAALTTYCTGTILCALAPFWQLFSVFRAITGFGAVGAQGPMSSLLAETWPAKYRSRVASVMMSMWGVAACFGAVFVMIVAPKWGWRGTFIIGGVLGLVVIPFILKGIKETGRFSQVAEERKEQKRSFWADLGDLFSNPRWRKHILIGMVPPFCQLTVLWAFLTLLPPYVMQEMGYSLNKGMSWFLVTNAIGTLGFLSYGPIADYFGRKPAFFVNALIPAVSLPLALMWAPNIVWFYALSSMALFGVYGTYSGIMTYLPELFPTKIRSSAVSISNQTGRILSMMMPFLLGILATKIGTALAVSLTSIVWVFMFIPILFGPETKGKTLEEITGAGS